jgi:hypothetical protein
MNRKHLLSVILVIFSIFSISWSGEDADLSTKGSPMAIKTIDEVLKEHTKSLMSIPGVVGTGQGLFKGKPCIKVFIIKKTPDLDQKIPKSIEGYRVEIEEIGEIKALPRKQDE